MLTIENYNLVQSKTYSLNGKEWLLYAIDESEDKYTFFILPKKEDGSWDNQWGTAIKVYRTKAVGNEWYILETEAGNSVYIDKKELNSWIGFMSYLAKANLI